MPSGFGAFDSIFDVRPSESEDFLLSLLNGCAFEGLDVNSLVNNLSSESPPSLYEEKNSDDGFRTSTSSPLLDVAPLPAEDDRTCAYCHQTFRSPRVMDCLHSMCHDCIIAQIGDGESAREARENASKTDFMLESSDQSLRPLPPGIIRCPVCKQESHIGNDESFVRRVLLDYVRLQNCNVGNEVRACRSCKSEQPAVAFCKQCISDLCKSCFHAHCNMKLFDGHDVFTYEEIKKNPTGLLREPVTCKQHLSVPVTALCMTCESLVCGYCQPEHVGHGLCIPDEKVADAVKQELNNTIQEAYAKVKQAEEANDSIPQLQQAIADQADAAYESLEEQVNIAFQILHNLRTKVKFEIEDARSRAEATIDSFVKKSMETVSKVHDAADFTTRLVDKGTVMEILDSRKKVLQQLTFLTHAMPDLTFTTHISFQKASPKELASGFHKIIGRVDCSDGPNPLLRRKSGRVAVAKEMPGKLEGRKAFSDFPGESREQTKTPLKSLLADSFGLFGKTTVPTSKNDDVISIADRPLPAANIYGAIGSKTSTASLKAFPSATFSTQAPGSCTSTLDNRQKSNPDFCNGWPPASLPSEDKTPSPLSSDLTANQSAINSNSSSVYNWPPSSHPPLDDEHGMRMMAKPSIGAVSKLIELPRENSEPSESETLKRYGAGIIAPPFDPLGTFMGTQTTQSGLTSLTGNGFKTSQEQLDPFALKPFFSPHEAWMRTDMPHSSLFGDQFPPPPGFYDRGLSSSASSGYRFVAPKNNSAAADLSLLWQAGGLGANLAQLNAPHSFCLGPNDNILVADTNNHRIQVFSKAGEAVGSFGAVGTEEGRLYYPKKIVPFQNTPFSNPYGYIIVDRGGDNKTRLQFFSLSGVCIRQILVPFLEYVTAITVNDKLQLVLFDSKNTFFILNIEQEIAQIKKWMDCSKYLSEPSDMVYSDGFYFVADYKQHRIVVLNSDGEMVRMFGSMESTPYPIGIDVSKMGDVLVADSHGNHFHILALSKSGQKVQDFECTQLKVSRCSGLRATSDGYLISLSRHNHSVLLFDMVLFSN